MTGAPDRHRQTIILAINSSLLVEINKTRGAALEVGGKLVIPSIAVAGAQMRGVRITPTGGDLRRM